MAQKAEASRQETLLLEREWPARLQRCVAGRGGQSRARRDQRAQRAAHRRAWTRALSEEERALAASDEQQRQVDQAAADTRRRTEQALLASYQSEDELRRVFNERTGIVDNSIRTARYNVTSLREGLVSLLRTAGDQELAGKPVAPKIADNIGSRHRELQRQRLLQTSFERQRVELDAEIADILRRYRELKGLDAVATEPAAADAAGPTK